MFPNYRYSPCLSRFEPVDLTILSKYSMTIQALCLLTVLCTPLYCCFFKADCCPHGLCLSGVMLCEDLHQIWDTWRDTVRRVFILSKFHLTRYLNGIWQIFYVPKSRAQMPRTTPALLPPVKHSSRSGHQMRSLAWKLIQIPHWKWSQWSQ
jgi:hypothetical protein